MLNKYHFQYFPLQSRMKMDLMMNPRNPLPPSHSPLPSKSLQSNSVEWLLNRRKLRLHKWNWNRQTKMKMISWLTHAHHMKVISAVAVMTAPRQMIRISTNQLLKLRGSKTELTWRSKKMWNWTRSSKELKMDMSPWYKHHQKSKKIEKKKMKSK